VLIFGVLLVALFAFVAIAQGLGGPSISDDDVAVVEEAPNGTITQEDLDASLRITAAGQGLQEVPSPDDEQYAVLEQAAVSDAILTRWVFGEADERGIEITDTDIGERLDQVINDQFGSQKEFDRYLEDTGVTVEQVEERMELTAIGEEIEKSIIPTDSGVSDEEIEAYYDENQAQFVTPETRNVRQITVKDQDEAAEVLSELERDDSAKSWEALAKEFSTDETTRGTGGLRESVVEGQSEPLLDQAIFSAPEGELVGPIGTDTGVYIIQVESITPEETTPLEEASETIRQTLAAARQQQLAAAFQTDFDSKWRARTVCNESFFPEYDPEVPIEQQPSSRCGNAPPPPSACTKDVAEETGCGAAVPSTKPVLPGTAGIFGAPAPAGLPQGPCAWVPAPDADGFRPCDVAGMKPAPEGAAPAGLPEGLIPTTPGATPPSGAAPPPGG
jgi:foldase protein PrsA